MFPSSSHKKVNSQFPLRLASMYIHTLGKFFDQFRMTNSKLARVKTKECYKFPKESELSVSHLHITLRKILPKFRTTNSKLAKKSQFFLKTWRQEIPVRKWTPNFSTRHYTWKFLPCQYDKFKRSSHKKVNSQFLTSTLHLEISTMSVWQVQN